MEKNESRSEAICSSAALRGEWVYFTNEGRNYCVGFVPTQSQMKNLGDLVFVLESQVETGEWSSPVRMGDLMVAYRDCRKTWLRLTNDEVVCQDIPDRYRKVIEKREGEGDYCDYCGAFNGPNGESRMGWECGYCGGV
jgi:hypothetical protein